MTAHMPNDGMYAPPAFLAFGMYAPPALPLAARYKPLPGGALLLSARHKPLRGGADSRFVMSANDTRLNGVVRSVGITAHMPNDGMYAPPEYAPPAFLSFGMYAPPDVGRRKA